ncbi:MAG: hypothetical protein EBT07_12275 [Actinobacteria bacterium]|nr:hypothetical protein [Actinomycetota bacterium]
MSFDKFIQSRTIAQSISLPPVEFPQFKLASFINFETDGYLVGVHFMMCHNSTSQIANAIDPSIPSGAIVAKVSGEPNISIPEGGNITNYSGAQILLSHLSAPSGDGSTSLESDSRQTTIAYDVDSKRIPIKSNDKLGVYLCSNSLTVNIQFHYTLTAYFVRS